MQNTIPSPQDFDFDDLSLADLCTIRFARFYARAEAGDADAAEELRLSIEASRRTPTEFRAMVDTRLAALRLRVRGATRGETGPPKK